MVDQERLIEHDFRKAFPFDVLRYRQIDTFEKDQLKRIIDRVWHSLPICHSDNKRNKKRYREMVKNYVFNMIKSAMSGYYVRVSRNKSDWHYITRYSRIFTRNNIIIGVMDTLEEHGWVNINKGYYDRKNNRGNQTRFFPSEKFFKLLDDTDITAFQKIPFIPEEPKELIQFRHKISKKHYELIPYVDTPLTRKMRNRLELYNDLMTDVQTQIKLELHRLSDGEHDHLNSLLLSGILEFNEFEMEMRIQKKMNRKRRRRANKQLHGTVLYDLAEAHEEVSSSQKQQSRTDDDEDGGRGEGRRATTITKELSEISLKNHSDKFFKRHALQTGKYRYLSIEDIKRKYPKYRKFQFRIHHMKMYRAFSDTSSAFNHHGRFYGDIVQSFPDWARKKNYNEWVQRR